MNRYREKLDMLLEALKEENLISQTNEELTRTLNDISQQNQNFGGNVIKITTANITSSPTIPMTNERRDSISKKGSNKKTEKDKYNTKERRNSRYYVRNGDKEAIQSRANSLKRAINTVMEHSGLYDHKPRHGSRKHSLAALNISTNQSFSNESQTTPPPPSIIEPTNMQSDGTIITNLSPLPDQRRSSMDEYFFSSLNLPVPKQFADAISRRSSGVPEPIKEEESYGHSISSEIKLNVETEYNYDVAYLCSSYEDDCESAVPIEVYERNLLRATNMQQQIHIEKEPTKVDQTYITMKTATSTTNTLQVPTISMSEIDMMERSLTAAPENVYTNENMTIIDTDQAVSL